MALLAGPEELSGQITRMVAIFRKQLGMDAPADLLMSAWTFAKALRLPDYRLEVCWLVLGAVLPHDRMISHNGHQLLGC